MPQRSNPTEAWEAYADSEFTAPVKTRGASGNPANRFEKLHVEIDPTDDPEELDRPRVATQFFRDATRSIIARNDSPDIGFQASVNPYRGCEHGCAYCYARPTHEYLGFSAGLDFETRIMVKENAAELLEAELSSPKWEPQTVVLSGVTDPYQPVERRLRITRRCLEVLAKFRNPVGIVTKNKLVTRDIDVLRELAEHNAVAVNLSVTSLDRKLQQILEPRTSPPQARLDAIARLRAAGIPVGVMVAPIIPGITDHEVPAILEACGKAGAQFAGYVVLRLPWTVAPLFERWLGEHFPERKEKVLGRLRSLRGGEALRCAMGKTADGRRRFRRADRSDVPRRAPAGWHGRAAETFHRGFSPTSGAAHALVAITLIHSLARDGARVARGDHPFLFPHHQQHGAAANRAEAGHDRIPDAPAVAIDHPAGERQRDRRAVVLKRIDHAGGEARHFPAADIHRRGGADDGVGGVRGQRDQNQKKAADENTERRRPHQSHRNDDGCDEDDGALHEIERHGHGRAVAFEKLIGNHPGAERTEHGDERHEIHRPEDRRGLVGHVEF